MAKTVTLEDFLYETDANLGMCIKGPDHKHLFVNIYGELTDDIHAMDTSKNDDEVIIAAETIRVQQELLNIQIVFYFNSLNDYLIAQDVRIEDLDRPFEQFQTRQAKFDKNWIEWFKNPIK